MTIRFLFPQHSLVGFKNTKADTHRSRGRSYLLMSLSHRKLVFDELTTLPSLR